MITIWERITEPTGRRWLGTWRALFRRFETPDAASDKMALRGWAPTHFTGDRRALANVERVFAVGLDIDSSLASYEESVTLWEPYVMNIHTTWSSTPEAMRFRVVLPTKRAMTAAEYVRVRRWCARRSDEASQLTDDRAADPSRLWFVPGVAPGRRGEYRCTTRWNAPLDVDAILEFEPELPPPPPAAPTVTPLRAEPTTLERAAAYLQKCDPAISGAGGHTTTLLIAEKITVGFLLDPETAYGLLAMHWNPRCQPPWGERELRRKCHQSMRGSKLEPGALLHAPRRP